MKGFYTLLFVVVMTVAMTAQRPGGKGGKEMPKIAKIFGTVYDSIGQKPLEFATVTVFRMRDSAMVGGMITDSKGKFQIDKVPVGRHRVTISYMGYGTLTVNGVKLPFSEPSADLGRLYIAPTEATLSIAEVSADKAVFQMGLDKKVFNVDKTNLGESENATEILRATPTVEVDFEGGVKIRGSAVQVYINGRPTGLTGDSQAEILDQLPANTVKAIELITNPSAKYDPEGGSGIINIVLKKNVLEGFTGSAKLSVGTSTWVPFRRYSGALSLNFKNDKFNIFSNFSYNYSERYTKRSSLRHTTIPVDTSFLEQFSNNKRIRNGGMARVGMDYYFDDYNTLTIAARIRPSGGGSSGELEYHYMDGDKNKTEISKRLSDGQQNRFSMTYNLIYSKVFKKKKKKGEEDKNIRRDNSTDKSGGHKHWRGRGDGRAAGRSGTMGDKQELVVDLQYSINDDNNTSTFLEQFYQPNWTEINATPDSQITQTLNKMHQGVVRIDYTHPFGKQMKIEAGYNGNVRWIGKDFKSESFDYNQMQMANDTGLTNNFEYMQQVHALYITFGHKVGKFSYKLGLRGEYTLTNSRLVSPENSTFINNYPSIFPTAHVSYELPKNQQVQLGFSRRIDRPSTWRLNPFAKYSDPLNLRYGNPFLLPQYTNAVELSYVNYWKGGNTIMLTGFYKFNTDLIDDFRILRSDGVTERTPLNFNSSHNWGGELVTRFVPFKWWSISLTANVYQNIQDGSNVSSEFVYNAIAGSGSLNMNFTFKFGMRIGVNAYVQMPKILAQGSIGAYSWNSISISQKVLKNKGTLTLSVQSPVNLPYQSRTETSSFTLNSSYAWEGPVFNLSFSYRFGKVNVRDSRSKNAGRLNSGGSGGGGEGL
jgi:iron complex outermembrane receptor protein